MEMNYKNRKKGKIFNKVAELILDSPDCKTEIIWLLKKYFKDENDLIRRYRTMAIYPEVDIAITDIINDAVVIDDDKKPIELNLDSVDISDNIKTKILKNLEDNNLIAFKYCDEKGNISDNSNPNGSSNNIAGILNNNKKNIYKTLWK